MNGTVLPPPPQRKFFYVIDDTVPAKDIKGEDSFMGDKEKNIYRFNRVHLLTFFNMVAMNGGLAVDLTKKYNKRFNSEPVKIGRRRHKSHAQPLLSPSN